MRTTNVIANSTGQYELLELLGEGGVGQVYAARDRVLGRRVAIKALRSQFARDRDFLKRFYSEAQRLGELNHPNITTLYALHLEGQEPFMVMELVQGRTLEALLNRVHRLPLRESLAVVAQTVSGLAYAHRLGIVHRDIKPANLMVSESGSLKIMDFGIARVRGSQRLTRAGQMFGTLLYASPEQIRGGDVDERSDLYSLAVVLYEMLAGTPPFEAANDHELMTAHLDTPPPPLSGWVRGIDPRVDAALMRALAKKPEDRFAAVEEFGHAVGVSAVRGEVTEILQTCFAAALRDQPAATRLVTAGAAAEETRFASDDPPIAGLFRADLARDEPITARGRRPASMRLSIAGLGTVAIVLVIGLSYIILSSSGPDPANRETQQAQHIASSTPAPVPQTPADQLISTSPPQARPAMLTPPTTSEPNTEMGILKGPPPADSSASPSQAASTLPETFPTSPPPAGSPAILPAAAPEPAPTPAETSPTNPPHGISPADISPASLPKAAVSPPPTTLPTEPGVVFSPPGAGMKNFNAPAREKPDLQGKVSAVKSASTIRVDEQWIDLYGISDPTSNEPKHVQAMIRFLNPSRGVVECYRRTGGRYQCYVDGADLGLMALRGGIARPATDAPSDYAASLTSAH